MAKITRERAEKIARAHACEHCGEYNYRKLTVKPATKAQSYGAERGVDREEDVRRLRPEAEMGIDEEGEIVWVTQP